MKAILALALLLSLSGCSKYNGDKLFDKYQQRLARVLELDAGAEPLPAVTLLPAERDLKQPLPDLRLDMFDAYSTRRCGLDLLVGERNSSLGKVYTASKQLSYELRFLHQLQLCLQQEWQNTALLSELQQIYQQKQQSIGIAFQNMLLTDNTLRKELLGIRQTLPLHDVAGISETRQALTSLVQLQQMIEQQDWQAAQSIDIEQQLQQFYKFNFLSQLQFSLRSSSHHLQQINLLLQPVTPEQLCLKKADRQQLDILTNLFQKFFIGEVQQYTVNLQNYQQQLWPLLSQLYRDTELHPALQQRFDGSYQQMQDQLSEHVKWWQALNARCPLQLTTAAQKT